MRRQIIKLFSEDNNFQHIEVIKRNREKRHRYGKFFVEGVNSINLAIQYNWNFDSLIFSSKRELSDWAKNIIENVPAENVFDLPLELMDKLSDKEEASELLALVSIPARKLSDLSPTPDGLIVLFDRPSSPGNLGTLIRSANSFGADAVLVSGHAVDPYDSQVLRASVGSFFAIPVVNIASHKDLLDWLNAAEQKGIKYKTIGTSANAESACYNTPLPRPLVVLLGNETSGLSRGYQEMSEVLVNIPIDGAASSLNVSCAASIILYEISRQRVS